MRQPKPTTSELIEEYAHSCRNLPVEKFLSLEGWREHPIRMGPPNWNDRNGRVIQGEKIWFFKGIDCSPVRLLIPEGADREEVIILLKKITRRLCSGWWEELWRLKEERPIEEWGLDPKIAEKSIIVISRR